MASATGQSCPSGSRSRRGSSRRSPRAARSSRPGPARCCCSPPSTTAGCWPRCSTRPGASRAWRRRSTRSSPPCPRGSSSSTTCACASATRSCARRSTRPPPRPSARRRTRRSPMALVGQPGRRVWHRAASVIGADEEVAAELEDAAALAQRRGDIVAAVAALERAAGTPGRTRRSCWPPRWPRAPR